MRARSAAAVTGFMMMFAGAQAHAESVRWALCQLEQGCQLCELPITHLQADLALSALGTVRDAPGHTVTVMRNRAGEWTWYYDTRRSPAELHAYFGGSGEPNQGTCAALPGDLQPRDGKWSIQAAPATSKNCPAGLDAQLQVLPMPQSGPVVFDKPFRASSVLPGASWIQIAPNRHVGSIAPAGNDSLKGHYTLEVVSETAMRGELKVTAPIPGQPACEIRMGFNYSRSGD